MNALLDSIRETEKDMKYCHCGLPILIAVAAMALAPGFNWVGGIFAWVAARCLVVLMNSYASRNILTMKYCLTDQIRSEQRADDSVIAPALGEFSRFIGGTMSFTFNDMAFIAHVLEAGFDPSSGPGYIRVRLASIRSVTGERKLDEEIVLKIPCFLASVHHRPREMVIEMIEPPAGTYGPIFSFRVKD